MKWEWLLVVAAGLIAFLLFFGGVEVTTAVIWDDTKPLQLIDLSKMEQLRQEPIIVYFHGEHRGFAKEIADTLVYSWLLVKSRLGLKLGDFGVALIEAPDKERVGGLQVKRTSGLLRIPRLPFPQPVTSNVQSLKDASPYFRRDVYWTLPHEATHRVIHLDLDRQARGIEEGLAEYVGYTVTKQLDPEALNLQLKQHREQVQALLQSRERPFYDLTQEFLGHSGFFEGGRLLSPQEVTQEEIVGYGVSLAFWLQIVDKHGEVTIRKFLGRLSKLAFPTARDAARILSELTGEDIWTKLQNMDLHEVLRTLEAAASAS